MLTPCSLLDLFLTCLVFSSPYSPYRQKKLSFALCVFFVFFGCDHYVLPAMYQSIQLYIAVIFVDLLSHLFRQPSHFGVLKIDLTHANICSLSQP